MYSDMKRVILCLSVLFLTVTYGAHGQSISQAKSYYAKFLTSSGIAGREAEMYNAVYNCYTECLALVDMKYAGTQSYSDAKEMLQNIWAYLYNGAAYFQRKSAKTSVEFAKAYVDIPDLPAFARDGLQKDTRYAGIAYVAASGSFNAKDYRNAVKYSDAYLKTGVHDMRKEIFKCKIHSYTKLGDNRSALRTVEDAIASYPNDFDFYASAINISLDCEDYTSLQRYLDTAKKYKPNDVSLLNIQGKLYEDTGEYLKAYTTYQKLKELRPRNLDVAKHLARNCYNLGVLYYNKNLEAHDKGSAAKYLSTSRDYFRSAIPTFKDILVTEPASLEFLEGLATIYQCVGDAKQMETVNAKIRTYGGTPVSLASVPSLLAPDGNRAYAAQNRRQTDPASYPTVSSPSVTSSSATTSPALQASADTPKYSAYAKEYVEQRLEEWQKKDPYETISEYKKRVTEKAREEKVKELLRQAETSYVATYANNIRLRYMVLRPYDAEHEVFLAESDYGELIIPVPRANNEARIFEGNWNGMQFRNPQYKVINDRIVLTQLSIVSPTGKTYQYNGRKSMEYSETQVDIAFKDIDYGNFAQSTGDAGIKQTHTTNTVSVGSSDVDVNIPLSKNKNYNTFAVIIANENYEAVASVPMALNDGRVFGKYCERTLGLPKDNIRYYENASYGSMLGAIRDIKDIASTFGNSEMNLIFYYSGHGIPDEDSKDGYLLPVDADGRQMEVCYSLNRLYSELGSLRAGNVTVFLDACFSGSRKDGDVLLAARGVALKAKQAAPVGNMVVFSAASGSETAFPYEEKGHGLFTYYLLKKLQETEGNVSLGELSDYIVENVRRQSVIVNHKSQTPNVLASFRIAETWKELKLKTKK